MNTNPPAARGSGVLTAGFGTTVALWAIGYVCRLPAVMAPEPVLLGLLLATTVAGGAVLAAVSGRGFSTGFAAGVVSGLLNLLVLGGLLSGDQPNALRPSALLWIPGSILLSGVLAGAGAAIASRWTAGRIRREPDWAAALAWVAALATALLLAVGGLVTSQKAGLSVVDWPNSFGYGMFLYPLSRMTGGIYYEHAHRLIGSLVGLTILVLAIQVQRTETRASVRRMAWAAFAMVVVQGILGGLRVTGTFTLSDSPADTSPSTLLAVVHGVFGQLVFATMVVLAIVTTRRWKSGPGPVPRAGADTERSLGSVLVALLVVQIVLGAIQRHFAAALMMHVTLAVIVAPLALIYGARGWGLNQGRPILARLGTGLMVLTAIQVLLGLGSYAARASQLSIIPQAAAVAIVTAHQWTGALLLACALSLLLWNVRLLAPPATAPAGTGVLPPTGTRAPAGS